MVELKARGLSIGDRAKVRVLLGDMVRQLGSLFPPASTAAPPSAWENKPLAATIRTSISQDGRRLQDNGPGGASYDTIAIVLSVLVGAVGYMVQA